MSADLVPHIPEDAPFTAAQRAWLNGFLAGLYSYAPAESAAVAPKPLRVALLYGSQTGTAEGLARKFAKDLKASGFEVVLSSLEGYVPATLAAERFAIFIVSTYGEGEAPDAAQAFFEQLCIQRFPFLEGLSYAVLALGDSHYEQFCQFGRHLDARLASLAATRLSDRVDCDVDPETPYTAWKQAVLRRLREISAQSSLPDSSEADANTPPESETGAVLPSSTLPARTRENPCYAPLVEKRSLTHRSSSKLTIHLRFATAGSPLRYEAGDACGVIPQNSPDLADSILELLRFTGNETVEVPKHGRLALREALREKCAITRLTRKMLAEYASLAQCRRLQALLMPEQQEELSQYLNGRDVLDLLQSCPGAIQSPDDLVKMLPPLVPRLYSISSSPLAHPGEIHATVAVVRYRAHDRDRGGVCSTLLSDRVQAGDSLPLYIQPNHKFRLPKDPDTPMIMIGPGTGIAPFRAFLHERRAAGAAGKNWLFFGERSAATDFLYRDEIEQMLADGHLTHLDTAFSRDQEQKVYVQDLMLQNADRLWTWIEEGASIYVCGDASRMAKDVDRTLHAIAQTEGGMSQTASEEYVQTLRDNHRYQRDVY